MKTPSPFNRAVGALTVTCTNVYERVTQPAAGVFYCVKSKESSLVLVPGYFAPVLYHESKHPVLKRVHAECIGVVIKMCGILGVQHPLQEALAQGYQIVERVLQQCNNGDNNDDMNEFSFQDRQQFDASHEAPLYKNAV